MVEFRVDKSIIDKDLVGDDNYNWLILKNRIPMYEICEWLEEMGLNSKATAKRYAFSLVKYLRFINSIGKEYNQINSKKIIRGYINHLMFGTEDGNLRRLEPNKDLSSVLYDMTVLVSFYEWLEEQHSELTSPIPKKPKGEIRHSKRNRKIQKGYFYGQIWDADYKEYLIQKFKKKRKTKSNHHKWYSKEEIDALSSNFNTLRDKVIFLITVEGGLRIDETVMLKYESYDSVERTVYVDKSKTFDRKVVLPQYVCDEIDNYVLNERQEVEAKVGIIDWLFINLKKGKSQGERIKYRNYYGILKDCAKRAGLEPKKIITHAGRSTRAQELVENQVLYPDAGITDTLIMEIMGWTNAKSIEPYKKRFSAKLQKKALEKIPNRKRNDFVEKE